MSGPGCRPVRMQRAVEKRAPPLTWAPFRFGACLRYPRRHKGTSAVRAVKDVPSSVPVEKWTSYAG